MAEFTRRPTQIDDPAGRRAPLGATPAVGVTRVTDKRADHKAVEIYAPPKPRGDGGRHGERVEVDHEHPTVKFHARWHAWRAALVAGGFGLVVGFLTNEWVHRSISREAVSVAADAVGSGVAIGSARRDIDENANIDYGDDKGVANRGRQPQRQKSGN